MKIGDVIETRPERNLMKVIVDIKVTKTIYGDAFHPVTKWKPILSRAEEKALDARLDKLIAERFKSLGV